MSADPYSELKTDKEVLGLLVEFLRKDKVRLLEQATLASRNSSRLATLYAAVDCLHAACDRAGVLETIEDIIVNVIGAAEYKLVEEDAETGNGTENALVCIPLRAAGRLIGIIAIFALKPGKSEFKTIDRELFEVLSRHAGVALVSSRAG